MQNSDVINNLFSLESGNIKNIPSTFVYKKYKFKDYEIKVFDGVQYIIPTIQTEADVECKTGNLLFSLLALKEKLKPVFGIDYISKGVPNEYINQILKWSKKHGIPFWGNPVDINGINSNKLFFENDISGFSVRSFISQLIQLENAFFLFQILIGVNNPNNRFKNHSKKYAAMRLGDLFAHLNMKCSISIKNGLLVKIEMRDLFSAALYQLLLYINNPTNSNVKKCECCGQYCTVSRNNQKYCSDCSPQKAYKRRKSKTIS